MVAVKLEISASEREILVLGCVARESVLQRRLNREENAEIKRLILSDMSASENLRNRLANMELPL